MAYLKIIELQIESIVPRYKFGVVEPQWILRGWASSVDPSRVNIKVDWLISKFSWNLEYKLFNALCMHD